MRELDRALGSMAAKGVSSAIVERVARLNPNLHEGERPHGIHYKSFDDPRWWMGCVTLGECHRKYGRAWAQAVPASQIVKRGRRKYVSWEYVQDNAPRLP